MVIELSKPMEKLASELENHEIDEKIKHIRECLLSNRDSEGNELATINIELSDEAKEVYEDYCKKYNLTLNEMVWLILEKVIDSKCK